VSLALAPGQYTLTASFAGDTSYLASNRTQALTVYQLTRFVVWAPNATLGALVQFYGDDWAKQVTDRDARKPFNDFKGYAEKAFDAYWTGRPGDKVKAPATVPQYIGVILATSASRTKDVITGDVAGVAILRVAARDDDHDRGKGKSYDGKLGDRGFGTVIGFQTP
jgi:hypothetical protein